jgi:hypothetical protein
MRYYILAAFHLFLTLAILGASAGYLHSEVKPRDSEMIMTAYMNGFVAAVDLDIEEIQKMKTDKDQLKQQVEASSAKYLRIINGLNK